MVDQEEAEASEEAHAEVDSAEAALAADLAADLEEASVEDPLITDPLCTADGVGDGVPVLEVGTEEAADALADLWVCFLRL